MGWVEERRDRSGKTRYRAKYRDVRGHQRSAGTFSTVKAAERAWHKAELKLAEGKILDPKRGRQTLTHYTDKWFPDHVLEASTREGYRYMLDRYILPELGSMRMAEILPEHVKSWITALQGEPYNAPPRSVEYSKTILDAILTAAFESQVTFLHAGRGVKTPTVPVKVRQILTPADFACLYAALVDPVMRLLVETAIETGLRYGELTELRRKDFNFQTGRLIVRRAVVELKSKNRPDGKRFVVKDYPKSGGWRSFKVAAHLVAKIEAHCASNGIGDDDLIFTLPQPSEASRRSVPAQLPDPDSLGLTEPNAAGRSYKHGTASGYNAGKCRCQYCRDAMAFYRAARRGVGKDEPRRPRTVAGDGHIPNSWFRRNVWLKALKAAELGFHITPHALRHAHASWLIAGGADLQVVKERLGHGSITTTELYLHTLPDADDGALSALDAIRDVSGQGNHVTAGQAPDAKDEEIAELRRMVASLSGMLAGLGPTNQAPPPPEDAPAAANGSEARVRSLHSIEPASSGEVRSIA